VGKTEQEYQVLLEAATPELYRQNAFRITGLPITVGMGEVKRRAQSLSRAKRLGLNAPPGNGGYLPLQPPPDEDTVGRAVQRLHGPESRLIDEFFWFWPEQPRLFEDGALEHLRGNRINEALRLWLRHEQEGSEARVSTHNLAVLCHLAALDIEHKMATRGVSDEKCRARDVFWQEAFRRWGRLLKDEWFWSRLTARIRQLDDPRLTTGTARRIRKTLPKAILLINARLAVRAAEKGDRLAVERHLGLVRALGVGEELVEEVVREVLQPAREQVKMLCASARDRTEQNARGADQVVWKFLEGAWSLLATIDLVMPDGHAVRDNAHNEIAATARDCLVVYGNETEDWKQCLRLAEACLPLSEQTQVRQLFEEDMEFLFTHLCGEAAQEATANVRQAYQPIRRLTEEAWPLLEALDRILPEDHPLPAKVHDMVALTVRNCTVAYGKETEDWGECLRLLQAAFPLAAGLSVFTQYQEDITALRGLAESRQRARPASVYRVPVPGLGHSQTRSPQAARAKSAGTAKAAKRSSPRVRTSRLAIASFVLGLLSLVTVGITGIPGLILGISAMVSIRTSRGKVDGMDLAAAGVVASVIGLLILWGTIISNP